MSYAPYGPLLWAYMHLAALLFVPLATAERTISHVSVRLPVPTSPEDQVRFPLVAKGGCYEWRVLNTSLLLLEPINDPPPQAHCSSVVQLVPAESVGVASTKVLAIDGDETLVCDVFLAPLRSLHVLTTTRTIVVDDLHVLNAQAFDDAGNVFTGLPGLRLKWDFSTGNALGAKALVNLLSVDETSVTHLEEKYASIARTTPSLGLEDETVVVKGMQPGKVTLELSIVNLVLSATPVEFNIVDNLAIVPPLAKHQVLLLMVNEITPVPFRVQRKRKGVWEDIDTKADGFMWNTQPSKLSHIEAFDGKFLSFTSGDVLVSVRDQHFEANAAQQPVQLVHPVHLTLRFHLLSRGPGAGAGAGHMPFATHALPPARQQKHILARSSYLVEARVYDATVRRVYVQQAIPVSIETLGADQEVYDRASVTRMDAAGLSTAGIANNYTIPENFFALTTRGPGALRLSACLTKTHNVEISHVETVGNRDCVLLQKVRRRPARRVPFPSPLPSPLCIRRCANGTSAERPLFAVQFVAVELCVSRLLAALPAT